jgi:predicted transcriptional regulator
VNDSTRPRRQLAALILRQEARSLDDAAEMFIRQIQKMHNRLAMR